MDVSRRGAIGLLGAVGIGAATGTAGADLRATAAGRGAQSEGADLAPAWTQTFSGDRVINELRRQDGRVIAAGHSKVWNDDDLEWQYTGTVESITTDGSVHWRYELPFDDPYRYDFFDVAVLEDGLAAAGTRFRTEGESTPRSDPILVRLDDDGTEVDRFVWEGRDLDEVRGAVVLGSGRIALLTQSDPANGPRAPLLRIVNPDTGTTQSSRWVEYSTAPDYRRSVSNAVDIVPAGDGALVAASGSSIWPEDDDDPSATQRRGVLLRIGEDGDVRWHRKIEPEGHEWIRAVAAVDDGFLAVGQTTETYSQPAQEGEGLVIALDDDGRVRWRRTPLNAVEVDFHGAAQFSDRYLAVGEAGSGGVANNGRVVELAASDGSVLGSGRIHTDRDRYTAAVGLDDPGVVVAGRTNESAGTVSRLVHAGEPTARIAVSETEPAVGETVRFDGEDSTAPVGIDEYEWDLDDDGSFDRSFVAVGTSFDDPGEHPVTLRVTDDLGETATTTTTVTVQPDPDASEPSATDGASDGDETQPGGGGESDGSAADESTDSATNQTGTGDGGSGEDASGGEADTDDGTDDSGGDGSDPLPGFGIGTAIAGLAGSAAVWRWRSSGED